MNPYAPPGSPMQPPSQLQDGFAPTRIGAPRRWKIREIFVTAWRAYKAQWIPLSTAALLQLVVSIAFRHATQHLLPMLRLPADAGILEHLAP